MSLYPTKEEILARPLLFKRELLAATKAWKAEHYDGSWATKTQEQKIASLCTLVDVLDNGRRSVKVSIGLVYRYFPAQRLLEIDGRNPSIISTIHEMGHHVRGWSELEACRYSVFMFQKVFPKAYAKLTWKGHMLVRAA